MIYWEKKGGKQGEGEREREREMRCHWGIPLSSPVSPPLSRAVRSVSPSASLPPPLTSRANFLHSCDPRHLARRFLPLPFVSFVSGGLPVSSASASLSISYGSSRHATFLMSAPLPPLLGPLSITSLLRLAALYPCLSALRSTEEDHNTRANRLVQ